MRKFEDEEIRTFERTMAGDVFLRARRQVLGGWKAGSVEVVEIVKNG